MTPSISSLDRLPKGISEKWEDRRRDWESELRAQEDAVSGAAVLAVSLDGVMAPMKDGQREAPGAEPAKRQANTGPVGLP